MTQKRWKQLNRQIVNCDACPRLRQFCRTIAMEKRKMYRDETYWGRPVANLGNLKSSLLVVGLAPGAHGANRTGRMFTGDRSGDWLYRALYRAGFANQAESIDARDGLELIDCVVTNVCRCAPPGNKPLGAELENCRPFLEQTLELCAPRVIIALGGLAWRSMLMQLMSSAWMPVIRPRPKFGHGAEVTLNEGRTLLGSYHPSQQNTFTGKLTESMLDGVFQKARKTIERCQP